MHSLTLPDTPRPLLARLLAPPGPARPALYRFGEQTVVGVPGRYCVTYLLIGPEGIVMVDCGSTVDLLGIQQTLDRLGRSRREVLYVLPSHLHFDHILGLDLLARSLDAPVALGEVAREHVDGNRKLNWPRRWRLLRALPTWPMQGMPVFTRQDWTRLGFGTPWGKNRFTAARGPTLRHQQPLPRMPEWRVLHTPGHSDDALCLYHERAGWLIAGDTLRNFLGGEWNPLQTNPEQYEETRRRLMGLDVRVVFPGHGPAFEVDGGLGGVTARAWYMP